MPKVSLGTKKGEKGEEVKIRLFDDNKSTKKSSTLKKSRRKVKRYPRSYKQNSQP